MPPPPNGAGGERGSGRLGLLPAEPAGELERALAAAAGDHGTLPRLWQALYDGTIVLPVLAYDPAGSEGARVRFLSAPTPSGPLIFGFTSEPRFEATLPTGVAMDRIVVSGSALPRFWPDGHGLAINPGYEHSIVLMPWEVAGLPCGEGMALPHPGAVDLRPPDPNDPRLATLAAAVAEVPVVDQAWWVQVRGTAAGDGGPWRDVVVVAARAPADDTAAIHAMASVSVARELSGMLLVGRHQALEHPFVEAVVAVGVGVV